jgi:hypothetical protein
MKWELLHILVLAEFAVGTLLKLVEFLCAAYYAKIYTELGIYSVLFYYLVLLCPDKMQV